MLGTDPQAHDFDSVICRWFTWAAVRHTQAGSVQHCGATLAFFSKLALVMLAGQLPVSWKATWVSLHWGSVTGLPQGHHFGVILGRHLCARHYSPLLQQFLHTDLMLFWVIRVDCVRHLQFEQQIQGLRLKGAAGPLVGHLLAQAIGFFKHLS